MDHNLCKVFRPAPAYKELLIHSVPLCTLPPLTKNSTPVFWNSLAMQLTHQSMVAASSKQTPMSGPRSSARPWSYQFSQSISESSVTVLASSHDPGKSLPSTLSQNSRNVKSARNLGTHTHYAKRQNQLAPFALLPPPGHKTDA